MRAITITAFEGASGMRVAEVPEPTVSAGSVLVSVDAAAIGPWDAMTATGMFVGMGGSSALPQTAGWDVAGTVIDLAPDVTELAIGDRVAGFSAQPWTGIGVFAERVAFPAALLAKVPTAVTSEVAATLPVAGMTAGLVLQTADLSSGDTALVLGAAGAVGGYVTQLASQAGVTVVASVSAEDADEVRRLGASHVVDYTGDVAAATIEAVGKVTAIIDLAGPEARESAVGALAGAGRFVTTIPGELPDLDESVHSSVIQLQPNTPLLAQLLKKIDAGELVARSGATFGFDQVAEAFAAATSAAGYKVLLSPR